MSLLADLLSKSKNEGSEKNTAVPPHLASIVTRTSGRKKRQGRFIVIAVIVLFVVIVGFGAVYYANVFIKPSLTLKRPSAPQSAAVTGAPAKPEPAAQQPAAGEPKQAETLKGPAEAAPAAREPARAAQAAADVRKPEPRDAQRPGKAGGIDGEPASAAEGPKRQSSEKTDPYTVQQKPAETMRYDKRDRMSAADRRKTERDAAIYSARNYEETGNLAQAIASYRKALQFDGKNYIVMTGLAGALLKTGAYAESIQYSRLALNYNRGYVPAIINLAIASIQLGDRTEGEQNLLRARSLEPGNKNVLYNLALLYENQNRYQEAYDVYEKLASTGNGQGLTALGRILEKQGKREEAKKIYRDILASNTADPKTKQYANERLVLLGN